METRSSGRSPRRSGRGRRRVLKPAVVVGISGGDRTLDFSPTALSARETTIIADLAKGSRYGGAEQFYRVIAEEVRPKVESIVAADRTRSTLVGWSLGGQFVLRTLFEHPDAFQRYAAISPSIWWNDRVVLRYLPDFLEAVANADAMPSVFIGVDSLEEAAPTGSLPRTVSRRALAAEIRYARMVGNARDLVARLNVQRGTRKPSVAFRLFKNETHNSVPWAAVNPVLNFAVPQAR